MNSTEGEVIWVGDVTDKDGCTEVHIRCPMDHVAGLRRTSRVVLFVTAVPCEPPGECPLPPSGIIIEACTIEPTPPVELNHECVAAMKRMLAPTKFSQTMERVRSGEIDLESPPPAEPEPRPIKFREWT